MLSITRCCAKSQRRASAMSWVRDRAERFVARAMLPLGTPVGATSQDGAARLSAGVALGLGHATNSLAQLFRLKAIASTLGLSGLGVLSQLWATQALVLSLAPVYSGVALIVAVARAGERGSTQTRVLADARGLSLGISTAALVFAIPQLLLVLGNSGDNVPLTLAGLVGLPFAALALVEAAVCQVQGKFIALAVATSISSLAGVAITWFLAARFGLVGAAFGTTLAFALSWLVLVYGQGSRWIPTLRIDLTGSRELWRLGSSALLASLISAVGGALLRYAALSRLGAEPAGALYVLLAISMQLLFLASATMITYSTPRLAAFASRADKVAVRVEIEKLLGLGSAVFGLLILLLGVMSRELTELLSSSFAIVAVLLPLQLVGARMRIFVWLAGAYILPLRHRAAYVLVDLTWNSCLLAGIFLLGSQGLVGYVESYVLASLAAAAFVAWHARRVLGIRGLWAHCSAIICIFGLAAAPTRDWVVLAAALAIVGLEVLRRYVPGVVRAVI